MDKNIYISESSAKNGEDCAISPNGKSDGGFFAMSDSEINLRKDMLKLAADKHGVCLHKKAERYITYSSKIPVSDFERCALQLKLLLEKGDVSAKGMIINIYHTYADCLPKPDLRKNLIILSAASASGKTTVFNQVQQMMPMVKRVVTHTSRAPRKGEVNAVDDHLVTEEQFLRLSDLGAFAEENKYVNSYYGSTYNEIKKYGTAVPVVAIIDITGMRNIITKFPLCSSVFILPPSMEELKHRIISRGENTSEEIAARMAKAEQEISCKEEFDYIVKNYDILKCAAEIVGIVKGIIQCG